jgi:hypothetical protein
MIHPAVHSEAEATKIETAHQLLVFGQYLTNLKGISLSLSSQLELIFPEDEGISTSKTFNGRLTL